MQYGGEEEYLNKTLDIINDKIEKIKETCEEELKYVRELSKYHWEYQSEMDDYEKMVSESMVNNEAISSNRNRANLRKLLESKKSPYFGKLNVKYDEDDNEDYYIGTTGIAKDNDIYVVDWRSPIAQLFYKSKLGKTSYKAPMGEIDCELTSRKQIKIKDSKLLRVVDTDIHLDDEELQEVLSKSSSSKMRNIVSTIQEEQNEIIRNLSDKVMIVEGKAGSGKTSVGLHRLAYLLYDNKKSSSNNMLIFSPSDVFSGYIENVLPELGEENVLETTFKDFTETFLKGFNKLESYTEFIAKYYNNENSEEKNRINKFKFSEKYQELLDNFIKNKTNEIRFTDDVSVSGVTISKDYLNKLLELDSMDGYPLYERIKVIADLIIENTEDKSLYTKEKLIKKLRSEILRKVNIRLFYNEFLSSKEYFEETNSKETIKNYKYLEYPDIIGMLYMYFEILGYKSNNLIHHLVIDEVQDYTPLQLKLIKNLFQGASFTLLGDADQTINPYHKYNSLEDMKKIFNNAKYIELNKAYRSSPEIMNYASSITGNEIESIRRSENIQVEKKEVSKDKLFETLVTDILKLKDQGFKKICIITKNNNESKAIYEGLKDEIEDITVLSDSDDKLDKDILISPVYISKGLEFDAVINYNNKDDEYEEKDKYLYYIAATRAQHSLTIYNEPQKVMKKER